MISDEVIEAAAEALVSSTLGDRAGIKWEEFFEAAREALNAAAPQLMASALREAADRIMGPSDVPLDAVTCRWNAMELRERAEHLEIGEPK